MTRRKNIATSTETFYPHCLTEFFPECNRHLQWYFARMEISFVRLSILYKDTDKTKSLNVKVSKINKFSVHTFQLFIISLISQDSIFKLLWVSMKEKKKIQLVNVTRFLCCLEISGIDMIGNFCLRNVFIISLPLAAESYMCQSWLLLQDV